LVFNKYNVNSLVFFLFIFFLWLHRFFVKIFLWVEFRDHLELPEIWPGIVVTWSVSSPVLVVLAGGADEESEEHEDWQQLHLD